MDPTDLAILAAFENGLPLIPEPFAEIGKTLGLTAEEVLERTKKLQESGVIRRFRARINQRQVGISANALVAWHCNNKFSEKTGVFLGSFPSVTHCYERRPIPGRWEYSLYTVHHGRSREKVIEEVKKIADAASLSEYLILFSTEEFKRVPHVRIRENGRGS
ncbi:MAG: siroheme decarboxylase subunit beta [Methanoregula sp.]|jgi:DNA-binding Lrp family transcriptional regulator